MAYVVQSHPVKGRTSLPGKGRHADNAEYVVQWSGEGVVGRDESRASGHGHGVHGASGVEAAVQVVA
ncbi:hypothetical protein [Streptomyces hokutonensis]|uniref:DUF1918 domain-containing protein n=1 Tax=Streptomyces hokutonensis TaxID=1306990 RepID=A0ABW6MH42_9ACTN